jgi:hypothetical protein
MAESVLAALPLQVHRWINVPIDPVLQKPIEKDGLNRLFVRPDSQAPIMKERAIAPERGQATAL